jgi:hypothetical protein
MTDEAVKNKKRRRRTTRKMNGVPPFEVTT